MATVLRTTHEVAPPPAVPAGADLPLFRFGLRQLLVFFTLTCLLMAATATVHAQTAVVLVLATMVIALHVFGTALGTQLRCHANHAREHKSPQETIGVESRPVGNPQSATSLPPVSRSPWHERRSTPLPWLPRLVIIAALFGGALGVVLLSGTIGHRTSAAGIAVGSISLAVVAGWFAFVGYSFYGVFRHGLRDAMAEDRRDHSA
jgi:hypothetical protein